jgi:threonyl-tRNA synthetase
VLVVGDAEVEAGTVSIDSRDNGKEDALSIEAFAERVATEIKNRS